MTKEQINLVQKIADNTESVTGQDLFQLEKLSKEEGINPAGMSVSNVCQALLIKDIKA